LTTAVPLQPNRLFGVAVVTPSAVRTSHSSAPWSVAPVECCRVVLLVFNDASEFPGPPSIVSPVIRRVFHHQVVAPIGV